MSYDLISYIKHEETVDLEREIVAFFKKYGFDIELHPEFDLLKSSGFTPILFKKTSEFWTRIPNKPECDLVAGPELYVDPFHEERPQKCGIFHKLFSIFKKEEELSPLAEMNFSIVSASPRYITLDGLASFIFSAAICSIYKGILINFQGFYNVKSERLDEYLNAEMIVECGIGLQIENNRNIIKSTLGDYCEQILNDKAYVKRIDEISKEINPSKVWKTIDEIIEDNTNE